MNRDELIDRVVKRILARRGRKGARPRRRALWLSVEDIEALCPSCAKSMKALGFSRINVLASASKELIGLQQAIRAERLGAGEPGFHTRCMAYNFGRSFRDKGAFCAWLHERVTGKWPGET